MFLVVTLSSPPTEATPLCISQKLGTDSETLQIQPAWKEERFQTLTFQFSLIRWNGCSSMPNSCLTAPAVFISKFPFCLHTSPWPSTPSFLKRLLLQHPGRSKPRQGQSGALPPSANLAYIFYLELITVP